MIRNTEGHVLLVRRSIDGRWYLPGGGVQRRETVDEEHGKVAGFYTLAAASVALPDLPEALTKRLPRYPSVPVARMGRLAIGEAYQGRKLGAAMLWDAASRAARSELMAFALVVDAKDDNAQAFYLHHGFANFGSSPLHLIQPLTNIPPLRPRELSEEG
jgi:GNAT superfamily N-acetyltransferase